MSIQRSRRVGTSFATGRRTTEDLTSDDRSAAMILEPCLTSRGWSPRFTTSISRR